MKYHIFIKITSYSLSQERNPPSLVLDVAVPVSSTHDQVTIEFFGLNPGITRTNTLVEKVRELWWLGNQMSADVSRR